MCKNTEWLTTMQRLRYFRCKTSKADAFLDICVLFVSLQQFSLMINLVYILRKFPSDISRKRWVFGREGGLCRIPKAGPHPKAAPTPPQVLRCPPPNPHYNGYTNRVSGIATPPISERVVSRVLLSINLLSFQEINQSVKLI